MALVIVSVYMKIKKQKKAELHGRIEMNSIAPLNVNNILYDMCTGDGELTELPKIEKSQIKFGRLIGM